MRDRDKKFILKAVMKFRETNDIWNPYYRLGRLFSDDQLNVMSKTELNNLLKVAVECLDVQDYVNSINKRVDDE